MVMSIFHGTRFLSSRFGALRIRPRRRRPRPREAFVWPSVWTDPYPGEEPLWCAAHKPRNLLHGAVAPNTRNNRRLLGINQREASPSASAIGSICATLTTGCLASAGHVDELFHCSIFQPEALEEDGFAESLPNLRTESG